jgi:hypothetical protein
MAQTTKISERAWINCRLCEDAFHRRRETKLTCGECGNGACLGEHGNFAFGQFKCLVCGASKAYKAGTPS